MAVGVPKNQQIASLLRKRIVTGEYEHSEAFPPELELMKEFRVSRHTIRAAIQRLVIDGLIERRRGAGTIIVPREPLAGTWAIASLDHLVRDFYAAKLVSAETVPARNFPEIAKLFGLGKGDQLFRVVRVLSSRKGPFSLSTIFTRVEYGKRVPRNRITSKIFLSLLEKYCGVRAVRARQTASAAPISPEARKALGIKEDGAAMLVLERTFFSRSGETLEHVEMFCRPTRYAQVVEFMREDESKSIGR